MSKRINKGVELLILLLVLFSLIGCSTVNLGLITSDSDDVAIQAIANKAKVAIENKDVSMFMSIISQDYSDTYGGTYDSIYTMAQNMVDEIVNAEELADSYGANLTVDTSISNLLITSPTASSDFKITVNANILFLTVYSYSMNFEATYKKEGSDWKVTSMLEKS